MTITKNSEYPYNVLYLLYGKKYNTLFSDYLSEDQKAGYQHVFSMLDKKKQECLLLKYKDCLTYDEIGKIYETTANNVQQITYKALQDILDRGKHNYIIYGLNGYNDRLNIMRKSNMREYSIEYLDLPVREYNQLRRNGYHVVGDILNIVKENPIKWYKNIKSLGLSGAHVILAALKKEDIYEPEFDLLPKLNTKKSGNNKGMYITGDIKNMPIRIVSRDVYYFDDNGICIKNNIDCIINEKVKEHVLKAARGKDIYALSNFRDIMGILEQELEKKIDGYTQVLFKKAASLIKEGDSIDRFAEILQNVKKEEQKSMEDIKKVISKVELPRYYWNNNNEFVGIYMYIVKNYPDAMQIIRRSKKEIIQIALEGILKYKEYRNKGLSEDNMDFLGCRFESSDMMYVEFKIKRRGA